MTVRLVSIGFNAITVDAGRKGVLHQGFCQSGPMDWLAFQLANQLCGQHNAPTLEFMGALTFNIEDDCSISVTGPAATIWVNEQQTSCWQRMALKAGDQVRVQPERLGARHYVATPSGFAVSPAVGSACTVKRENVGGPHQDGSPLKTGDLLVVNNVKSSRVVACPSSLPAHLLPSYDMTKPVGIVAGYQHETFSDIAWQRLLNNAYEVTPQMDRMGVRLQGPAVQSAMSGMYSEAIALGSMQVPPDGQPIVMMADRQTLGGYPKVGTLARCDLYRFAQCLAGDKIQFYQLDAANARATWLLQQVAIQKWFGN